MFHAYISVSLSSVSLIFLCKVWCKYKLHRMFQSRYRVKFKKMTKMCVFVTFQPEITQNVSPSIFDLMMTIFHNKAKK